MEMVRLRTVPPPMSTDKATTLTSKKQAAEGAHNESKNRTKGICLVFKPKFSLFASDNLVIDTRDASHAQRSPLKPKRPKPTLG